MEKWVKNKVIPKGKWIRTRDGVIQHRHGEASTFVEVMVAKTPQELVRVGDLVGLICENWIERMVVKKLHTGKDDRLVYVSTNNRIYTELKVEHIDVIYTPNKDKTQYTQQWRKQW